MQASTILGAEKELMQLPIFWLGLRLARSIPIDRSAGVAVQCSRWSKTARPVLPRAATW